MVTSAAHDTNQNSNREPEPAASDRLECVSAAARLDLGSYWSPRLDSEQCCRAVRFDNYNVMIVADGFGNESAEVAAVNTITEELELVMRASNPELLTIQQLRLAIKQALTAANAAIVHQIRNADRKTAGCSVVVAVQTGQFVLIKSVGDCRAYSLRHHALKQLTQDHTLTHLLRSSGQIAPELRTNRRDVLLNYLGSHDFIASDEFIRLELSDNTRLLLTSRSLATSLNEGKIRTLLEEATSAVDAAATLGCAVVAQGETKITCVTMFSA